MEMEEQLNKEAKERWTFAASAARVTEETAGNEDRKHTSGGVLVAGLSGRIVGRHTRDAEDAATIDVDADVPPLVSRFEPSREFRCTCCGSSRVPLVLLLPQAVPCQRHAGPITILLHSHSPSTCRQSALARTRVTPRGPVRGHLTEDVGAE